jgi:predicted anti-sigma-YlaC factor YlaD
MANVDERVDERAEESAEEILARLERYVASVRAPRPVPAPVDTLIPSREVTPARRHHFVSEVAPALTAVGICAFVILLSEWFAVGVAAGVGGALTLVGVVGLVRRVPLARAYAFGLVIAALLIRLS